MKSDYYKKYFQLIKLKSSVIDHQYWKNNSGTMSDQKNKMYVYYTLVLNNL